MTDATQNPLMVWFEVPVLDLDRAMGFYKAVLGASFKVEPTPGGEHVMAIFENVHCPSAGGALVKGPHCKPTQDGVIVYFAAGPDLSDALSRVEPNGGKVVLPKMAIGPYGFIAHIIDIEGNRVALHSMG